MDLNDPTLWVAVGFVLLAAGVYRPAKKALLGMIDGRIEEIRGAIDEAVALREEAQQQLAECQRKQRGAAKEGEEMIARAEAEAARLADEGRRKLAEALRRREQAAMEKIGQAEADAVREIRAAAVEIAVAAARDLIAGRMDEARSAALIDEAVAELPDRLR